MVVTRLKATERWGDGAVAGPRPCRIAEAGAPDALSGAARDVCTGLAHACCGETRQAPPLPAFESASNTSAPLEAETGAIRTGSPGMASVEQI